MTPARPRPLGRKPPPAPKSPLSAVALFGVSNLAYLLIAAVIPAHLALAVEAHSLLVRLMTAVPAVVLILETRRFLKDEAGELPFLVLALFQYYVVFAFGVFFDLKFYDVRGPVNFSENARNFGAVAVAIGSIALWAGARLGRHLAGGLRSSFIKMMPSREVPEEWDKALYLYVAATVAVSGVLVIFPSIVPAALTQIVAYGFSLQLAMGFAIVMPLRALGLRAPQLILGTMIGLGMLGGSLDPVFRGAMGYITGRWAVVRAVSIRLVAAVLVLYVVTQPVKGAFRQQVWFARGGHTVGMTERVDAWGSAYGGYFADEGHSSDNKEGGMARLSELGAVMHAFDVVPGRVGHLDGTGFLPVLTAPIPRFLWANKPTTNETVQRYAVIFGRQSEVGARTTAINLPLLVEGYWNFGWPGIVFVCVALGVWVGVSQRLFGGDHWAMRAVGIANIATITVAGPVVLTYSAIFQTITGRVGVCWAIFWLATLLSRRRFERPLGMGRQPMLRMTPSRSAAQRGAR